MKWTDSNGCCAILSAEAKRYNIPVQTPEINILFTAQLEEERCDLRWAAMTPTQVIWDTLQNNQDIHLVFLLNYELGGIQENYELWKLVELKTNFWRQSV